MNERVVEIPVPEPSPLIIETLTVFARHGVPQVVAGHIAGLLGLYEDGGICRECGCSEFDPCINEFTGQPCAWHEPGLCTACVSADQLKPQLILPPGYER